MRDVLAVVLSLQTKSGLVCRCLRSSQFYVVVSGYDQHLGRSHRQAAKSGYAVIAGVQIHEEVKAGPWTPESVID